MVSKDKDKFLPFGPCLLNLNRRQMKSDLIRSKRFTLGRYLPDGMQIYKSKAGSLNFRKLLATLFSRSINFVFVTRRYMKEIIRPTSDAKDNLFISPPEMPLILPGFPMMVFWHDVNNNLINTKKKKNKNNKTHVNNKILIKYADM